MSGPTLSDTPWARTVALLPGQDDRPGPNRKRSATVPGGCALDRARRLGLFDGVREPVHREPWYAHHGTRSVSRRWRRGGRRMRRLQRIQRVQGLGIVGQAIRRKVTKPE